MLSALSGSTSCFREGFCSKTFKVPKYWEEVVFDGVLLIEVEFFKNSEVINLKESNGSGKNIIIALGRRKIPWNCHYYTLAMA